MPILASKVKSLVAAALDAEGSDYYTDQQDYIPAINRAQDFIVSIINSNLGAKKFAEENYRELIKCLIFQTSVYSRISVVPPSGKVWTILSVVAEPEVALPPNGPSTYVPLNTAGGISAPNPLYVFVGGGSSCSRDTAEEWATNAINPFKKGYELEPASKNIRYGYLHHTGYGSNVNVPNEIEIRPHLSKQPVAIYYVKVPSDIAAMTDSLDFPDQFTDVIVKATLREIAYKQGDHTSVYLLSNSDVETLIKSLL